MRDQKAIIAIAGVLLTLAINLAAISYWGGRVTTALDGLERRLNRVEQFIDDRRMEAFK